MFWDLNPRLKPALLIRRLRIWLLGTAARGRWTRSWGWILTWRLLPAVCSRVGDLRGSLERRLVRGHQQSSAVGGGVVNKLPLVVMIFLIELADGFIFAGAGHSYNGASAENLGSTVCAGLLRPRLSWGCIAIRRGSLVC